jgi:hypothetical protein
VTLQRHIMIMSLMFTCGARCIGFLLFIAVAGVIAIIVLKVVNPNKSKVVATINNASDALSNVTGLNVSSAAVQLLIAVLNADVAC